MSTREEIIRMARAAGFDCLLPSEHIDDTGGVYVGDDDISGTLERFAAFVAAAEREACAKIVEQYCGAWDDAGYALSQAIRARGQE